jgi:hypothetical protein
MGFNLKLRQTWLHRLVLAQALFYVITGLWPLIDLDSFMSVTGLKNDWWLVRTVGVLVTGTGLVLFHAYLNKAVTSSIALLAIANALGLAAIDAFYVSQKVIGPIYLLDVAAEVALTVAWLYLWPHEKHQERNYALH